MSETKSLSESVQNSTPAPGSLPAIAPSADGLEEINLEMQPIQCRLAIGSADDPLEKEADTIADRIMRMSEPNFVSRKCAVCEEEEHLQRKPLASFIQKMGAGSGTKASESVASKIQATKGTGNQMENNTRSFMESRFGTNFSQVNIHTGQDAVQMNQELNAQAFTIGKDIYFNSGKYAPESESGKHLLAHELTHTIQQLEGVQRQIQRLGTPFGPAASGPSDWATQVSGATTSAQKTALIRSVTGSAITVNDATAASASDSVPDPTHLRPFTLSAPVINFDQNLASKRARAGGRALTINAGYTFQNGAAYYVIIGDSALDERNYGQTLQTINHEFDHINQYLRNSSLVGNESELDAWITTFVREFHHSYQFSPTDDGTTCYVELKASFAPLLMYYQLVTNASQRTAATTQISTYYNTVINPNAANTHAFRFWVHRSMRSASNPDLGTDVNTALSLGITASGSYRAIPCANVPAAILPGGSTLSMPTAPLATGSRTSSPKP